uniref:Carrier domain-containing protein n=1 Tax=Schlesneria paludicola TaxID=360056 RepID=A0A7C2JZZ3_9PLAN
MPAAKWTHAAIMEQLPAIIADCLGIDETDVQPESNFKFDLGGESIDELDLSFRCERAFGVNGPFQPLMQLAGGPRDGDGCLESAHFQQFLHEFPFLAERVAATGRSRFHPDELKQFFTTAVIASFVEAAVQRQSEPAD